MYGAIIEHTPWSTSGVLPMYNGYSKMYNPHVCSKRNVLLHHVCFKLTAKCVLCIYELPSVAMPLWFKNILRFNWYLHENSFYTWEKPVLSW